MGIKWNKKLYLEKINRALMTPANTMGMQGQPLAQPSLIQRLKDVAGKMRQPPTMPTGTV
jgi:hypothetical protein